MPLANNFTFRTSMQEPGSNYSIHVCPSSLQQVLSSSRAGLRAWGSGCNLSPSLTFLVSGSRAVDACGTLGQIMVSCQEMNAAFVAIFAPYETSLVRQCCYS